MQQCKTLFAFNYIFAGNFSYMLGFMGCCVVKVNTILTNFQISIYYIIDEQQ